MAADNGRRLISKIVRERHINSVLSRGVQADWFPDLEDQRVYSFLVNHVDKYGEVPTAVTVRDNYPTYRMLDVQDSLEYLLDQMLTWRRSNKSYQMLQQAVDLVDLDPNKFEEMLNVLRSGLADLDSDVPQTSDYDLTEDPTSRLREYENRKGNPDGMLGIPTGFPTIDKATAGLQPQQLVTIYAAPKVGKSQLALKIAEHVHGLGFRPMYQSFEMSNDEQQERFDSMKARVSHNRLRRGTLTPEEEARYEKTLKDLEGKPQFLLSDASSGLTVSALGAHVSTVKPDIVFVDGVYLMMDEVTGESNTPQALTNITRSFKRLAQRLNIPIVITTQALRWKMKKNSVNQDSIGYSSSFLQDSDVLLALEQPDQDNELLRNLRVVASRHCGAVSAECLWDWGAGRFEEFGSSTDDFDGDDEADSGVDYSEVA